MAVNPDLYGFSAEYRGDRRVNDGFDEYPRVEFPKPITKVWRWRLCL
jgi:hypothetical protein